MSFNYSFSVETALRLPGSQRKPDNFVFAASTNSHCQCILLYLPNFPRLSFIDYLFNIL
jgi:hypothetical protein